MRTTLPSIGIAGAILAGVIAAFGLARAQDAPSDCPDLALAVERIADAVEAHANPPTPWWCGPPGANQSRTCEPMPDGWIPALFGGVWYACRPDSGKRMCEPMPDGWEPLPDRWRP